MNDIFRNRSCILDLDLALSPYGVSLAGNLNELIQIWLVPELCHILNDINFYLQRPELFIEAKHSKYFFDDNRSALEAILLSLKNWEIMKSKTDLANLNLFWIGDNLQESLFPKGQNPQLFWHWEYLARSLDIKLQQIQLKENNIALSCFRDTAALAASLKSSFILTLSSSVNSTQDCSPNICKALTRWGISCQVLSWEDPDVVLERELLRRLFFYTGLNKLFWTEPRLAVLHLVSPTNFLYPIESEAAQPAFEESTEDLESNTYFWMNVQGFWYFL